MTEKVDEPLTEEIQKFCDPGFPIYRVKKVELVTADEGDGDDRGTRRGKWIISKDVCFVYRDCDRKWRINRLSHNIQWLWIAERKLFHFIAEVLQVIAAFERISSEYSRLPLLWTPSGRGGGGGRGLILVSIIVRVHKARVVWNQEITIVYDERRWKMINYLWNLCCQERWTAISEKKKELSKLLSIALNV